MGIMAIQPKIDKIVAVDSGRSGCKCCYYKDGKYIKSTFASKHGLTDFNHLKAMPIMTFNPNDQTKDDMLTVGDMIVSIDGSKPYIMGNTCDRLLAPENIIYATQDEIYLEYAINYILTMIAKVVDNNEEITLAINLTFNNIKFRDDMKEKLKGTHNVKFFDPKSNITLERTFDVKRLTILPQGWSSLMYRYLNNDLSVNNVYAEDGILLDIGRKTVDILFNRELNTVKGLSYDLGTEYIFDLIHKFIFNEHNIRKSTMDIEQSILRGKKIFGRKEEIDPRIYLKDAVLNIADRIRNEVLNEFGDYTPQYTILTGGGSYYFKDVLAQIFPRLETIDDPIFSNAIGMCRFVVWNVTQA